MVILLHSSKTMRGRASPVALRRPLLLEKTKELDRYLKTLSAAQIEASMHVSAQLAEKTKQLIASWSDAPNQQSAAIDSFIGDIYSGLQASELSDDDRKYADRTLLILSGLYGVLRPNDSVMPYRLEMGYKFPDPRFANLYDFWGPAIAEQLPTEGLIVNASSTEYMRAVAPYIDAKRMVTPRFLTVHPKTGQPTFMAVHAKIARGAFARWLITSRTTDPTQFKNFSDLGYRYDESLNTELQPTFVCEEFGGKGLSIRLK